MMIEIQEAIAQQKLHNDGWYGATQMGGGPKILKKKQQSSKRESKGGKHNKHLQKVIGEGRNRLKRTDVGYDRDRDDSNSNSNSNVNTTDSSSVKNEWVSRPPPKKSGVGVADAFLKSETARRYMDMQTNEWNNTSGSSAGVSEAEAGAEESYRKQPLAGWIGDYGGTITGGFKKR